MPLTDNSEVVHDINRVLHDYLGAVRNFIGRPEEQIRNFIV